MSEIHLDDMYCGLCGEEDPETIHHESEFNCIVCDTCCNSLVREWGYHVADFPENALDFSEWLKLAQPTRILKVDWTPEEIAAYTLLATAEGLTLDELVERALTAWLDDNYSPESS